MLQAGGIKCNAKGRNCIGLRQILTVQSSAPTFWRSGESALFTSRSFDSSSDVVSAPGGPGSPGLTSAITSSSKSSSPAVSRTEAATSSSSMAAQHTLAVAGSQAPRAWIFLSRLGAREHLRNSKLLLLAHIPLYQGRHSCLLESPMDPPPCARIKTYHRLPRLEKGAQRSK